MAAYVVFAQLTPQGRMNVRNDPGRVREVTRAAERLGARITAQYALMGPYDFVTFIEAPDNITVERIETEISTIGAARLIVSPAIAMPRFMQLLKLEPYRTEPHRWQTSWWARIVRGAGRYWVITRHVQRYCRPLEVEGGNHLRDVRGGAIIIANHSSHFDTPVAISALPGRMRSRLLVAAAADKFYASRKKRTWWYSLFHGTFPVHRGGGLSQLEYPRSLLRKGWSVLIYPEGGRSRSGQVQRFKAGPAIMAMQADVPVVPIYMEGLREIMPKGQREPRPGAVRVRIGEPVWLEGVESVKHATAMLENAMRELAGIAPRHRAPKPEEAEMATARATTGG